MSLPSPLTHSWPLFEQNRRFDLGVVIDIRRDMFEGSTPYPDVLARQGVGLWGCDLRDDTLSWSAGVFDLFGLPRAAVPPKREETVALYAEQSRATMERLRAYAIKHRRGFTLDAEIIPVTGPRKWMRLIAAPVCVGSRAVRLHGLKQDVSAAYK